MIFHYVINGISKILQMIIRSLYIGLYDLFVSASLAHGTHDVGRSVCDPAVEVEWLMFWG